MSKIKKKPKLPSSLFCNRFYELKKDANREAAWMKKNGGTYVTVVRVSCNILWRVRCKLPLTVLAKFCAREAFMESMK